MPFASAYTAAPYKYVSDGDYRVELEDTYLRLDAQLGRLLNEIDSRVGLGNALIFLSSTGYYDDATPDDPKFRIPTGEVSLKRVESLLNSYLSAKYGNADYVRGVYGNQLYLDHKALESHGLAPDEAQGEARDFLVKMSGISDARTLSEIFLTLLPGWSVIEDSHYPPKVKHIRSGMVSTPFFLLGSGVKAEVITMPVDAAALAPTVTSTLHIRSPNGASRRPVNY